MLKGFTRRFKPLEILTDEEVEAIHRGTLDVLETTGVRIEHGRALNLLADHGCKVDFDKNIVRIPCWLVEDCLRKVPHYLTTKGRDPKNDVMIGGNILYFENSSGMRTVDLDTLETRPATKKEFVDAVRVMDALDNVHIVQPLLSGEEGELATYVGRIERFGGVVRNTTKATLIMACFDTEIFTIKMAAALGVIPMAEVDVSSPLTFYSDQVEGIYRFAEAGLPLLFGGGSMLGATAPTTLAGAMILNNAEIAAGLVLIQLIKPGLGVLLDDYCWPIDMVSGNPTFGALGAGLHMAVFNQTWRKWGIPVSNGMPGYSLSKKMDFQCGYEKALGLLVAALSGANRVDFQGCISSELTVHPVQAILDDDIAGWVGRFIEGIDVNDDTLAVALINKVGPIPGQYLGESHTREWWKKEQYLPKAADRLTYPEWIRTGKKGCLDYAKERMEEILTTHEVEPLTEDQEKTIAEILEEARSYYTEKGMI